MALSLARRTDHQLIFDILNGVQAPANPAFTAFSPVPFPRVLPF